jgi:glycerol-3-phosphate dehydrogenase
MSDYVDVAVIGGGIQGCGVAQAAAAAGYRTVLLEKTALAHGTSSKSSKLIHGGLRYLESAQFSLVRQSLYERELLIRNAPDLVNYTKFYLPVYKSSSRHRLTILSGLSLYALLGNLQPRACFRRVPPPQWSNLDGLERRGLQAVYQYWDGQTDDVALTRAVMASAQQLGAHLLCPASVEQVHYQSGEYHIAYQHGSQSGLLRASTVINAAGAWVDAVHARIKPNTDFPAIELVQGTHLILQQTAPSGIYYLESPTDRRAVFVMPWYGQTLIGTTETAYHGDPEQVSATEHEIDYLRNIARHYFPQLNDTVVKQFSGLRVLPAGKQSMFHRPRETVMFTAPTLPGYIALIGGKLTGYRATAEKVVTLLQRALPAKSPLADTKTLRIEPVSGD